MSRSDMGRDVRSLTLSIQHFPADHGVAHLFQDALREANTDTEIQVPSAEN